MVYLVQDPSSLLLLYKMNALHQNKVKETLFANIGTRASLTYLSLRTFVPLAKRFAHSLYRTIKKKEGRQKEEELALGGTHSLS